MENGIISNIALDEPMFNPENTEANIIQDENIVTLETIHNDLGIICCFLVITSVVIFIRMILKFFNMFF